jgi:hypothetical protein
MLIEPCMGLTSYFAFCQDTIRFQAGSSLPGTSDEDNVEKRSSLCQRKKALLKVTEILWLIAIDWYLCDCYFNRWGWSEIVVGKKCWEKDWSQYIPAGRGWVLILYVRSLEGMRKKINLREERITTVTDIGSRKPVWLWW